jgi:hypothetical protein
MILAAGFWMLDKNQGLRVQGAGLREKRHDGGCWINN